MADVPRSSPPTRRSRLPWVAAATAVTVAILAVVITRPGGAGPRLGTETTINLGGALGSLTFAPTAGGLFGVTDAAVMVVDPTSDGPPRRLRAPTNPVDGSVAVDPVTNTAWVSNNDRTGNLRNRRLSILDISTGRFVETMMLPHSVIDIAIDAAARRVLVIHRPDDQQHADALAPAWITVMDADSHNEVATVEVPFPAYEVTIATGNGQAVVTGRMGATLLSTNDLTVNDVGIRPQSSLTVAAVDPKSATAYVLSSDTLYTVDMAEHTVDEAASPARPGLGQFAVDPEGRLILVDADRVLKVVDPDSLDVLASRPALKTDRTQLAVDPKSGTIFVADGTELTVIERP
ncbi:hypothetical protein BVC93_05910 [Mycobacterium sp. MS1601]|uniref:hypothetical protein n=1 Tax=Mycobacterium sp. MS1601 TaxID=1936029 RepID=UPI00097938ED|nr:hypothetical protein [Mycobacterium sp. MS1601]AQA02043.1 hypothetical protein BVC93_05910 [Mycobacterium sp. MS1601]